MLAEKNENIKRAYDILQVVSKDEEKRMIYEARQAELMDQRTREKVAEEKGIQQGIEQGIQEGIRQEREQAEKEKLLAADKLLSLGLELDVVAETLGLSRDVLQKLSKQ